MKKALIALALATLAAPAAALPPVGEYDILSIPNRGGGRIELSQIPVPVSVVEPACKGRKIAKSWGPTQADTYGCWTFHGGTKTVNVVWLHFNGRTEHRTYNAADFDRVK